MKNNKSLFKLQFFNIFLLKKNTITIIINNLLLKLNNLIFIFIFSILNLNFNINYLLYNSNKNYSLYNNKKYIQQITSVAFAESYYQNAESKQPHFLSPHSTIDRYFTTPNGYIIDKIDNQKLNDNILSAIKISESGMNSQSMRLKIIAQNIANSEVTGTTPGADTYRRKIIFFKNSPDNNLNTEILTIDKIDTDKSPFIYKYEPNHVASNEKGYVKYPNINILIENVDEKEAARSFEANMNSLSISKSIAHKTLDIMK